MRIRLVFAALYVLVGTYPAIAQNLKTRPNVPPAMVEPGAPLEKDMATSIPDLPAEQLEEIGSDLPLQELARISKEPVTEASSQSRSAKDAQLYRMVSPSVVLIATKTGLGSGSLIDASGEVLTNWHVVRGYSDVGVMFKPAIEGKRPTKADLLSGRVIKYDEIADLALVKVANPPPGGSFLRLGDASEISVGLDVHAIGHPTGETWTYTKGIISQYRLGFEWQPKNEIKHKADVIQTQTPINPGNSGGPLFGESGTLIGVNSFKTAGEGLNFAVSVDDVKKFLARSGDRISAAKPASSSKPKCKSKELSRWRTEENDATVLGFDFACWGKMDATLTYPDDVSKPISLQMDRNHDGRFDVGIVGNRQGRWVLSLWDENFDGLWDLVGYHDDGRLRPTRFESYADYLERLADP